MNPQFPIYIVSYKRWDSRLTVRALDSMKVPYMVIVDKVDYDKYASVIPKEKLLALPQKYRDNYDMYWEDDDKRTGAGAARNFAWEHSIKRGFSHHWVIDDNIRSFKRLHKNRKIKVTNGAIFKAAEDFVLRYKNVALSGFNYDFFCAQSSKYPPYVANTKVYSCLLIQNDIPFRWRGRYNEDVDISIRVLKAGYPTIQFNAFLQQKANTQTVSGGNMKEFYGKEGTYKKSRMLYEMHPDVVRMMWRYGRCHHFVDYRPFKKNRLIRKKGLKIPNKVNNYGMKLTKIKG